MLPKKISGLFLFLFISIGFFSQTYTDSLQNFSDDDIALGVKKYLKQFTKENNKTPEVVYRHKTYVKSPYYETFRHKIVLVPDTLKAIREGDPSIPALLLHKLGHAHDPHLKQGRIMIPIALILAISMCGTYQGKVMGEKLSNKILKKYIPPIPKKLNTSTINPAKKKNNFLQRHPLIIAKMVNTLVKYLYSFTAVFTGYYTAAKLYYLPCEEFADTFAAQNCTTREEGEDLIKYLENYKKPHPVDAFFDLKHPNVATRKKIIETNLNKRHFDEKTKKKTIQECITKTRMSH